MLSCGEQWLAKLDASSRQLGAGGAVINHRVHVGQAATGPDRSRLTAGAVVLMIAQSG